MNNPDFDEEVEKHKKEMMRLYGSNGAEKYSQPLEEANQTEMPNIPKEKNEQETEETSPEQEIEERFPVPEIPDFIRESTPENDSYGYLKVSVRTGGGGLPVANSLVTISEIKDGRENVIRMLTTDSSGNTEIIRLPAPINLEGSTPGSYDNFAKYNISAYSDGYYRETSVDAPIFSGVTSVQTFYLIPEPFDYNSGENTIVAKNNEPNF